jgi:hypothetical protein
LPQRTKMFVNLRGWTAGLFFGSLAYPLLHALSGGLPGLLVYGPITLLLITSGLALFSSSRISPGKGALVYIGTALILVFAAPFLSVWIASLLGV